VKNLLSNSPGASNESQLLKGALLPTFFVGVIALIISSLTKGVPGFLGAALAHVVVIVYFVIHILVSKFSRNLDPMSTMALAMLSYVSKLFLIALFLIAITRLTDPEAIHRGAFGATAIALTLAWLGGEIASFTKLRLHLPLPKNPPSPEDGE
jgi:ATP synthase protein I